jgi:hypothetical protein
MQRLVDIIRNPGSVDSLDNYIGELPEENILLVLTQNRDSDCLARSNFECALRELGGESNTVKIYRFGHWGCGWWEALCILEGSEEEQIATEIECALSDYPVLDDEHYSNLETEEANQVWGSCYTIRERVNYIRANQEQFEFRNISDMKACIKGEYFSGYANELIY